MTVKKIGDWNAARAAVAGMGARFKAASERANKQEAQLFRSLVVRAFNSRGATNGKPWPKLQRATIRAKGSSKPLIDSGQLRNSIAVIDDGDNVFVGIESKKQRSGGGPLVDIAAVHEFGKVIAQQRGGNVVLIKIPQRSFLQSTFDAHFTPEKVRPRILARTAIAMGNGWAVQAPASAAKMARDMKPVKSKPLAKPRRSRGKKVRIPK